VRFLAVQPAPVEGFPANLWIRRQVFSTEAA